MAHHRHHSASPQPPALYPLPPSTSQRPPVAEPADPRIQRLTAALEARLGDPGVLHAVAEALAAALAEVLPPEPVAPVAPAQPVGSPADPEALLNTLFPNTLYLSVSDCARLFGLGKPTVYRLVDAGAIPSVTITSRKLVSKATVLELMAHGLPT